MVRYDTEHGYAHRDIIDKNGNKRKTPTFTQDYNEASTFAEYDIKSTHSTPRSKARGMLRVDTERRF